MIEDCHEAIISKSDWERVQELIDRRPAIMKGNKCPYYNIFHGLVYCADCGKSMQARYEKKGRTKVNRFTKQEREPIDKTYYICQTYNRLGKNACTSHKIEARDLYGIVLADVQELAAMAVKDADAFFDRLSGKMERRYEHDSTQLQKEYDRLAERNRGIDDMFLSLYSDRAKGIITEQRFVKLTEGLETEQGENNARMQELLKILHDAGQKDTEIKKFVDGLREYGGITELDEAVLNRLIDRIVIGKPEKANGEKVQEVRIIYNFVGEAPADMEKESSF